MITNTQKCKCGPSTIDYSRPGAPRLSDPPEPQKAVEQRRLMLLRVVKRKREWRKGKYMTVIFERSIMGAGMIRTPGHPPSNGRCRYGRALV